MAAAGIANVAASGEDAWSRGIVPSTHDPLLSGQVPGVNWGATPPVPAVKPTVTFAADGGGVVAEPVGLAVGLALADGVGVAVARLASHTSMT